MKFEVNTIGEPGDTVEGYVVFGAKTVADAKAAITAFDNDVTKFPADDAFISRNCRLECWQCGRPLHKPSRRCSSDEEGLIWNFNPGGTGQGAVVVWMDGTTEQQLADLSQPAK